MSTAAIPMAGAPAAPARRVDSKWLITLSITFGTLMGAIDASIVNVALPHIRGSVGATVQEITWISTAYIIANVVVMPLTGFLGRMFGQKRVYMFCLILFLVGSALCGTARTLPVLIFYRTIQGLGAGALQPTEQAILRQTFPPEEQGMAMALFAMAVMIGPAVGPTLGGWITDNFSWPWIFYINLPIGILGLAMVWRFVHEPEDIRQANRERAELQRKNMDWAGMALLVISLAATQYVLEEGNTKDWFSSNVIVVCTFVGVFGVAAFIIRELTAPVPVVNVGLFKDRTYLSGTLIGGAMFAMLMGSMILLPVFTQEVLGWDATQSGLVLMPRTLIMMVATPIVGRLYNRVHPAITIAIGVVMFTLGSWGLSTVTYDTSFKQMVMPLLVTGVGFSCLFVPLTTVALAKIPRMSMTDATGLNSLVRQIGGSLGIALFANVLTKYTVEAHAAVRESVTLLRPEVAARVVQMKAAFMAHGMDATAAMQATVGTLAGKVGREATVLSFEKAFLVQGVSFLVVLPLLFFLKVDRKKKAPKVDMHMEH
jgi:DHA2 family multidrug resistance protein